MDQQLMANQLASNPDVSGAIAIFGIIFVVIQVLSFISFLLTAWGLFNINKKLGEPNAWLSWVPILNVYSFVRAAGKPNIWILWLILGCIAFGIPGIIIAFILLDAISKRTGGGIGRTLGFFFLGFIFFPLVGYQFKGNISGETILTPQQATSIPTENIIPSVENSVISTPTESTPVPVVPLSVQEVVPPSTEASSPVVQSPTTEEPTLTIVNDDTL